MFIGEYSHAIDEKGRLAVPAKFRRALTKGAVVTKGLDNCLFVYPGKEWGELAEKLSRLPLNQANARAFSRAMLAGAMEVVFDSQGRMLIPEYLRLFGGISKRVVVAGLYNRLEIWDEVKWQAYKKTTEQEGDAIAEKLGQLGI